MRDGIKQVAVSASKTAINSVLIAAITLAVGAIAYRTIKPAPKTGAELAIALAKQQQQSGAEDVASMIKHYLGVSELERTDPLVQQIVKDERGVIKVKGWSAKEVEPGMFLVAFQWERLSRGDSMGMYYEVDVRNRYVRPVVPDDELSLKYGMRTQEEFARDEAQTLAEIREKYPNAMLTYENHRLVVQGKTEGDYDPDVEARQFHHSVGRAFAHRKDRFLRVEFTKGALVGSYEGLE
jgi:hypothetical protein